MGNIKDMGLFSFQMGCDMTVGGRRIGFKAGEKCRAITMNYYRAFMKITTFPWRRTST
jgi:hypothetical protein